MALSHRHVGRWTISCRTPLRSRFTHESDSGRSRSTALTTALMSRRPRATKPVGALVYLNLREPPRSSVCTMREPGAYSWWRTSENSVKRKLDFGEFHFHALR